MQEIDKRFSVIWERKEDAEAPQIDDDSKEEDEDYRSAIKNIHSTNMSTSW